MTKICINIISKICQRSGPWGIWKLRFTIIHKFIIGNLRKVFQMCSIQIIYYLKHSCMTFPLQKTLEVSSNSLTSTGYHNKSFIISKFSSYQKWKNHQTCFICPYCLFRRLLSFRQYRIVNNTEQKSDNCKRISTMLQLVSR